MTAAEAIGWLRAASLGMWLGEDHGFRLPYNPHDWDVDLYVHHLRHGKLEAAAEHARDVRRRWRMAPRGHMPEQRRQSIRAALFVRRLVTMIDGGTMDLRAAVEQLIADLDRDNRLLRQKRRWTEMEAGAAARTEHVLAYLRRALRNADGHNGARERAAGRETGGGDHPSDRREPARDAQARGAG